MNTKKITLAIILVSSIFLYTSCGKSLLKETKYINKNSKKSIFIAGVASEFKDKLRDRLINRYKDKCSIEVVNLDKLAKVKVEEFQAQMEASQNRR